MNATKIEMTLVIEAAYEKLAAKHPAWAAKNKTYTGWKAAGRQVKRGARARMVAGTQIVGRYMDMLTGEEDGVRTREISVPVFPVEMTY